MLILNQKHPLYPKSLLALHDPPKQLFIEGESWEQLLTMPMLSVVGTRRPSSYGAAMTNQLVQEIASRGVVIVSGLALGIDSIAHSASIAVQGRTIAVMPAGLKHIYPRTHQQLAKDIISDGGALVSEYDPNDSLAAKNHFLERNRIIAALSQAILVPEAAAKSGSLHTVRHGLDTGKDIMALPGMINNPQAEGTNNLIKTGAIMITDASDVLNTLKISSNPHTKALPQASNLSEQIIIQLIYEGINDGDELLTKSGLPINDFNQHLTMLEITGKIRSGGCNNWVLCL
jgi:DNA processing protein